MNSCLKVVLVSLSSVVFFTACSDDDTNGSGGGGEFRPTGSPGQELNTKGTNPFSGFWIGERENQAFFKSKTTKNPCDIVVPENVQIPESDDAPSIVKLGIVAIRKNGSAGDYAMSDTGQLLIDSGANVDTNGNFTLKDYDELLVTGEFSESKLNGAGDTIEGKIVEYKYKAKKTTATKLQVTGFVKTSYEDGSEEVDDSNVVFSLLNLDQVNDIIDLYKQCIKQGE